MRECGTKRKENGRESMIDITEKTQKRHGERCGECTRKRIWKLMISLLDNTGGDTQGTHEESMGNVWNRHDGLHHKDKESTENLGRKRFETYRE